MPENMCFSMHLKIWKLVCGEQKSLKSDSNLNSHIPACNNILEKHQINSFVTNH